MYAGKRMNFKICHVDNMESVTFVVANPAKKVLGCPPGLQGSELTLYGEVRGSAGVQSRTKVKTNGHFTSYMQVSAGVTFLPKHDSHFSFQIVSAYYIESVLYYLSPDCCTLRYLPRLSYTRVHAQTVVY
jgi:hypothetical protein